MVKVGMVGFGFIGQMHFSVYQKSHEAKVVSLAELQEERRCKLVAPAAGNLGDATQRISLEGVETFASLDELLARSEVDMVDVCLPTYLHAEAAIKALQAGKNVLCEKPMAMNAKEAQRMIDAAQASGQKLMIAHCIRFWPEYVVLETMWKKGDLGKLKSLKCTRLSPRPTWSWTDWLMEPGKSGGALLDLHIHDVDYLIHLLGRPKSVYSQGAGLGSEPVEHVVTSYDFDQVDVCLAEGGWMLPGTFPFRMEYEAIGEKGVLSFSTLRDPSLVFYPSKGEPFTPSYAPGDGYHPEIEYFVQCVAENRSPDKVTPESSKLAVEVITAELESITTGKPVSM